MATERTIPGEVRIFLNHIYEFKKGVRNMVLYTMNREYEEFAVHRTGESKSQLYDSESRAKQNQPVLW